MSFNHELFFWKDLASTAKMCPTGYTFLKSVTILYCPVVSSWIAMYFWSLSWVWFLFPLQKLNNKCIRDWTLKKTPDPAYLVRTVHWHWIPSTIYMHYVCEKGTLIAGLTHKSILTPVPHRLQWELCTYVLCQMWAHLEQTLFPAI